jgi:hypothetical protein
MDAARGAASAAGRRLGISGLALGDDRCLRYARGMCNDYGNHIPYDRYIEAPNRPR